MNYEAILAALEGRKPVVPPDNRKWSAEQETFFDALLNYKEHLLVNAIAGSGKTTTMLEGAIRLTRKFPACKVLFLAFGKVIASELKTKIPSHLSIEARTVHAFCWKMLAMQHRPRLKLETGRVWRVLEGILPRMYGRSDDADVVQREVERDEAVWMASMCRHSGADPHPTTTRQLMHFHARQTELTPEGLLRVTAAAAELLATAARTQGEHPPSVDFDDMPWLALRTRHLRWPKYDVVFVDEAQDLNQTQIEVVMRFKQAGSRVIAVGDPDQAIFGWRGALPSAMALIQRRLGAQELPLSVTWRCPRRHVAHVKHYVQRIKARENAPEGRILRLHSFDGLKRLKAGDMVVGRTNAQVLEQLVDFVSLERPATMLGTEFGSELVGFVKRFRSKELPVLRNRASVWLDGQRKRLHPGDMRLQQAEDKVNCLKILADIATSVDDLKNLMDKVFSDRANAVRFSTVHRAKGLEADRVMICPGPLTIRAERRWQWRQEQNLCYVAQTRAKDELFLTADPDIAERDKAMPDDLLDDPDDSPGLAPEPPLPEGADPRYGW